VTLSSILIVGGTHGNESSGLALIHPTIQKQFRDSFQALEICFETGNPNAVTQNTRFTEEDWKD
jgi:aspartoacylase